MRSLSFLLLLLAPIAAVAQPTWRHYDSTNSPIPSGTIHDITVDRFGVGWIATDSGLAKLDHGAWEVFDYRDWNPIDTMGSPFRVWQVANDGVGGIWVRGNQTLARIRNGRWLVRSDVAIETVWNFAGDGRGGVWAMMFIQGRSRLFHITDTSRTEIDPEPPFNYVAVNRVGALFAYGPEWVHRFDGQRWDLLPRVPGTGVSRIAFDSADNIVVASGGVYALRDSSWEPMRNLYSNTGIAFDAAGSFWTTSVYRPLRRMRLRDSAVSEFSYLNSELSTSMLMALATGPDTTVWVGTGDRGLFILDARRLDPAAAPNDAHENDAIEILRNPAASWADVAITSRRAAERTLEMIRVTDGAVVERRTFNAVAGRHHVRIDISGLASGAYLLRLDNALSRGVRFVVVQ